MLEERATRDAASDSDDVPGSPRARHFRLFDSMRAVAVLGVILIHVGAVSGANQAAWYGVATSQGRLGVRIFFMISAFLLYRPYVMAQLHRQSEPRVATYASRRVLRILPAYWVALTLLAFWPGLPGVWTENWWIYYGILQAYWFFTIHLGLAVAWSLSIEVAFYAVLPVLALALGWLGRGVSPRTLMRRQLLWIAILGIVAEAFRIHLFVIERRDLNFTLPSMFLPFAVGMALAVVSAWLGREEGRWRWTRFVSDRPGACWAAAATVFIACCFTPIFFRTGAAQHTATTWAFEQLAYVVVSALLLLPAVFGEDQGGWPRRLLATRPMGFVGMVSYGIFLWHLPLLDWMGRTALRELIPGAPFLSLLGPCLAVSILMGWLSYRLIELPAMRFRSVPAGRIADA